MNIGVTVLGLYPVVNLLYILNIKEIKQWIARKINVTVHTHDTN